MVNIISFDIGTCTTVCSGFAENQPEPEIFDAAGGNGLYPSQVSYVNGRYQVGFEVNAILQANPANVATKAKRLIGTGQALQVGIGSDGRRISKFGAEIQGIIGKNIYDSFIANMNWPTDEERLQLAFTYPIDFRQEQIQEYKQGLIDAGLNVNDSLLFSEPLAALMYVAHESNEDLENKTVLLFDIGGGTTDIILGTCIKEDGKLVIKPRSIRGQQNLGGTEFDAPIVSKIREEVTKDGHITDNQLSSPASRYSIERFAERAKIQLCREEKDYRGMYYPVENKGIPYTINISREWYINATDKTVTSIVGVGTEAIKCAINDTKENLEKLHLKPITEGDIDYVVFIGGCSKVPMIVDEFKKQHPTLAGKVIDQRTIDPQYAVAKGAAYLAKLILEPSSGSVHKPWENAGNLEDGGREIYPAARSPFAYGISARDPETDIVSCYLHLYKNDVIPECYKKVYSVPENHSNVLVSKIYSLEDWTHEMGEKCDPNHPGCKEIGIISFDCPSDLKPHSLIDVTIQVLHNTIIHVYANVRGRDLNGKVTIY